MRNCNTGYKISAVEHIVINRSYTCGNGEFTVDCKRSVDKLCSAGICKQGVVLDGFVLTVSFYLNVSELLEVVKKLSESVITGGESFGKLKGGSTVALMESFTFDSYGLWEGSWNSQL